MKLFAYIVILSLSQLALADKLSQRYLPPNHAASSGGHASYLQVPAYQSQSGHYSQGSGGGHYASAASSQHSYQSNPIPILRNTASNDGNGNYNFGFETGNGIRREESGVYHPGHGGDGSQTVSGSYSFVGDDGKTYTVNYHADSTGFHAEGAHLPTAPPIPHEIQESLNKQSSHHGGSHGGYGGHSSYNAQSSYGGHHAAASAHQPSVNYLPPQTQRRGYNYGPGHY